MTAKAEKLMDAVYACVGACNHCYEACLQEEAIDMLRACIRSNKDCADICTNVLAYKGREEFLDYDLVKLCENSCQACAKDCEEHEDMEHCQKCAKACNDCAEACHDYINA
ncbi:protein of unknown function [Alkalibacterium subtropicum]|uniref:Four-helix bundle copper-binding protein n=1 Tax=Alkalibacterium subtropicum TaxID=753702 RepID=A0A1I1IRY6_9LACT|nr:four-helix bundle copper-binding protein [Alkalibacterium subtropicum]SFC38985.1 protein of unknown function [Alkalibacterium subtropicum]